MCIRDSPEGRTVRMRYDVAGNRRTETRPEGQVTTFDYDRLNRLTRVTDALGGESTFSYDAVGSRLTETDANGHTSSFTYDALNRLVRTLDPLGQQTTTLYDAAGNALETVDRRGIATRTTFDRENRPLSVERAGLTILETTYDGVGNKVREVDANGNATAFEYDERNLPLTVSRPLAAITRMQRDDAGDVTAETDPEGRILRRSYDPRRRLLSETNGAGETTTFAYDGNGNLTTRTLPLGGQWRFGYDGADRLVSVANPLNQATAFTYDRNDNLRTQTDAAGSVVSFRYDALDRRETKVYPDGAEEIATYDPVGNLRTRGDPNGQQVTFTYDALNREVERAYSAPFHPVAEVLQALTFVYDPNNNLTTATENYGATTRTTTRQYDTFDRLISVVDGFGQQLRYQYDANGNRTALIAPDGGVTTYRFDALNRPNAVTLASGGTATYNWRRNSLLRQVTYPNGVTTIHNYDAANRLIDLTTTQPGGITASAFEYEYDLNGNRTVQREENGTLTSGALEETTYQYDAADRLLAVTYPNRTTTYTLDAVGNRRTERTVDGLGTPLADRTYTYNARHHLTSLLDTVDPTGTRSYAYDANGNQIAKTQKGVVTDYLFDARNQLLEVQEGGVTQGVYSFDYQGLRVRKSGDGPTLRYLYDDQSVLFQTDDFGNPVAKYDYGPDRLLSLNHTVQGRAFYHFDTLGSIANLTDANGSVTARYQYDAWGIVTDKTGTAFNPFGFTGQELDEATGLYYFKARFYDPELGRFLSEDPFEGVANNPPSLHRYLYAFGNPTVFVDPDGRQTRARQKEDTEAAQRRAFLRQFGGRLRRGEEPPIGTVLTTNVGGVRIVTPIRDIQGEGALGISGSSVVLISESEVKPQGVVSILLDGSDIETPIDQAESAIANFEEAGESLRRADETLRGAIGRRDPTIQALIEERAVEEIAQPGGSQLAALGEATRQTGAATESAAMGSLEAFDAVSTVAGAGGILKAGGRRLVREGLEVAAEKKATKQAGGRIGERVVPRGIANPVLGKPRAGSALKSDPQHAFPDLVDNFATDAQRFTIPTRGPGGQVVRQSELLQVEGSLNGREGVFEWIVDQGQVTHRRFIPGGRVTGSPNQIPGAN